MKRSIVTVALTGMLAFGGSVAVPGIMLADDAVVQTQKGNPIGCVVDGIVQDVDENGNVVLDAQASRRPTKTYGVRFYTTAGRPYTNTIGWDTYVTSARNAIAALLSRNDSVDVRVLVATANKKLNNYCYNTGWTFERNCREIDSILSGLRCDIAPYRNSTWLDADCYWYDTYLGTDYRYWDRNWDCNRYDWRYNRYWDCGCDYYEEKKVETEDCYRLTKDGDHIFTTSSADRQDLIANGWTSEGTAWKVRKNSSTPIYEVLNPSTCKHFYTKSKSERDSLVKAGWQDLGTAFYGSDSSKVAVFRLVNSEGEHFFTKSTKECSDLEKAGWKKECIAFYVQE